MSRRSGACLAALSLCLLPALGGCGGTSNVSATTPGTTPEITPPPEASSVGASTQTTSTTSTTPTSTPPAEGSEAPAAEAPATEAPPAESSTPPAEAPSAEATNNGVEASAPPVTPTPETNNNVGGTAGAENEAAGGTKIPGEGTEAPHPAGGAPTGGAAAP
jgi:hypothetical protein